MHSNYIRLPYCLCVGIVLVNREGLIRVGQRAPECARVDSADSWHMPQGPIAASESACEVALRVLAEETGVSTVRILAEAPGWFTYDLPPSMIGVALNGQYCGQKQKWLAALFLGDDGEIGGPSRGNGTASGFRASRWAHPTEVPLLAPALKRELYEDVVATFAPFVAASKPQNELIAVTATLPWFVKPAR